MLSHSPAHRDKVHTVSVLILDTFGNWQTDWQHKLRKDDLFLQFDQPYIVGHGFSIILLMLDKTLDSNVQRRIIAVS